MELAQILKTFWTVSSRNTCQNGSHKNLFWQKLSPISERVFAGSTLLRGNQVFVQIYLKNLLDYTVYHGVAEFL